MISRVVVLSLVLVGCGEAARVEAPATSASAADDDGEGTGRRVLDRRESVYRGQIRTFLKEGFAVQGLGLPPEELSRLRIEASCQLDPAGVVVTCATTQASGNAKFDAAAADALEAKKGKQTPPPPADQPGWRVDHITFSLRCGPTCS